MISGSRAWYQMKGLARRNTHVKYESPTTYQSKVITKVKNVGKEGQTPSSTIRGSRSWNQNVGLDRRNTHVKYESPIT
jgi:hypothetical protein